MSELATAYWRVKRHPSEGTASAAIETHARACRWVAFVYDVHPDEVAEAVVEAWGSA